MQSLQNGQEQQAPVNAESIAVNAEMRMFMNRQDKINESLLESVKSIEKSITKSDSLQVEFNAQSSRMDKQEIRMDKYDDKIMALMEKQSQAKTQLEVNKTIIKQQQEMKAMFTKAFIGLAFAFIVAMASTVFIDGGDKELDKEVKQAVIELSKKNK